MQQGLTLSLTPTPTPTLKLRLAAEEEKQGTARAKLLLCRTKMAWATFNARNRETLTGPWSAWQQFVKMGRAEKHAAAAEEQREVVRSARAQAEEVAPRRAEPQAQP